MKRQSSETQRIIGERKILNKKRTPRKHKMRIVCLVEMVRPNINSHQVSSSLDISLPLA